MADVMLGDTAARQAFFRQSIHNNLRYWQAWAETHLSHPDALTTERDGIIRALSFAMKLESAWDLDYRLILQFSSFMERGGHWQAWESLLRHAMRTARRFGKIEEEAGLAALLGLMLQRQQKFAAAIAQHRYAIKTARQAGNHYALARSLTNLGYLYIQRGNWWRAEILCWHALPAFKIADNLS
ncbi:MAG TPA: tetratricopeptide repeat protein, partial [Anaerolineae bacterium]|nr:tetratricopeptide repeat protein [Anaerolineae bacterium]